MHYTHELMFQITQGSSTAVKNTRYPFACMLSLEKNEFESLFKTSFCQFSSFLFFLIFLYIGISRLPRTITSRIKWTSCGIKRILPDQPVYNAMQYFWPNGLCISVMKSLVSSYLSLARLTHCKN